MQCIAYIMNISSLFRLDQMFHCTAIDMVEGVMWAADTVCVGYFKQRSNCLISTEIAILASFYTIVY